MTACRTIVVCNTGYPDNELIGFESHYINARLVAIDCGGLCDHILLYLGTNISSEKFLVSFHALAQREGEAGAHTFQPKPRQMQQALEIRKGPLRLRIHSNDVYAVRT